MIYLFFTILKYKFDPMDFETLLYNPRVTLIDRYKFDPMDFET